MSHPSYLRRRGARYSYRRRLPVPFRQSQPITISLGTSDPLTARRRAAQLSVAWEGLVLVYKGRTDLTASEARLIFQDALERELVRAIEPYQQRDVDRAALVPASRFWAGVYWQAHRSTEELREVQETGFTAPEGTDPRRLEAAVEAYKLVEMMRREVEEECPSALQRVGVPMNAGTLEQALIQRLRGRAAAHDRAQLAADPRISSRDDLFGALLDETLIATVRDGAPLLATSVAEKHLPAGGIYLEQDTRRFWDVIGDVCRAIVTSKDWNNDLAQRKRIMKAFAWMTGNKRMCDYRPSDIAHYKAALVRLPTTFRWANYLKQPDGGCPNIDFADVLQQFPEEPKENVRDDRTINRDLSTMNRVSQELAKSAWAPTDGRDALIMNFAKHTNSVEEDDPDDPDRLPWTVEHLKVFFSSPVYVGGGGRAKRLKPAKLPTVWQDASYWVPLIAAYAYMSREETCGLEVDDIVLACAVPYLKVRRNMTKSRDGKDKAGLKTTNRKRVVPLHPELLRLGFAEYVEAIEAQGHACLFPELYMEDEETKGGRKFYARSFTAQVDAVDAVLPLPANSKGKTPDFHSFRTYGGSQFELADVKQLTVDRLLGHAPSGTGPRKYSRAKFTVEEETYLRRLLNVLVEVAPIVTDHLDRAPLRMLRLEDRSRTGSAPGRCASLSKAQRQGRLAKQA